MLYVCCVCVFMCVNCVCCVGVCVFVCVCVLCVWCVDVAYLVKLSGWLERIVRTVIYECVCVVP